MNQFKRFRVIKNHININKEYTQIFSMINWLEKNKSIAIIIFILISIEIFYFSSIQGVPGTGKKGIEWIPQLYHFCVFFLFNFFLLTLIKGNKKIKPNYFVIILLFSITQAFLDEFHQIFVPLRNAAIIDILTDSLGIFSSTILYLYKEKFT